MRRLLLVLSLSLGCRESLGIDPTEFACRDDGECGDGTVCLEGRCQVPWICGDGVIQPFEECDDGRPSTSGGCRECAIEFGYTCTGTIGDRGACEAKRYLELAGGALHLCAIREDGLIECTGRNVEGQLDAPNELGPFHSIEAGAGSTCAIRDADDTAVCWGDTAAPSDLGPTAQVIAAYYHACARTLDGYARCWGRVNGRDTNPIPTGVKILDLDAGSFHTCLLLESGEIDCWGDEDKIEPPELTGPFTDVTAGFFHTCVLRENGSIACWGRDTSLTQRTIPPAEDGFVEIASGQFHNCARKADGPIQCWGKAHESDDYGMSDPPPGTFRRLTSGARFTCGLREDGRIECWGAIYPDEFHPP